VRKQRQDPAQALDPAQWLVVGVPQAGSSASVHLVGAGGTDQIRALDRYFDQAAFLAWAGSVYERATAAWRDKNPELLRPVMAEQVWDRYAQFLLTVSVIALGRELMASAAATTSLGWADVDSSSQSALVSFAVSITGPRISVVAEVARHWQERWLFQRPADARTHPSGAVAVCLVCGGPADPADSGHCPYCHSDITTRTAGWLVTQVATTMHGAPKIGGQPMGPVSALTPLQPPRQL
jgi:hypothetical protein